MWFKIDKQQVSLYILAKPNAKKSALVAISEDALHVALHAKPKQGEANKELIAYLSKLLRLPKSHIILQRGEGSRHKQVVVPLVSTVQKLLDDPSSFISHH